jgi:hypothetical protein
MREREAQTEEVSVCAMPFVSRYAAQLIGNGMIVGTNVPRPVRVHRPSSLTARV